MHQGRKVIVVTPAGRREYMEILIRYVLKNRGLVDEYHLWMNTTDQADIDYLHGLEKQYPGFVVCKERNPNIEVNMEMKGYSIHQFFRYCTEPNTVYVRLDDDICFVEHDAIERLVEFRIANPQYFLTFANTVNNALCSHLHQRMGLIDLTQGIAGYWCTDQVAWEDPRFAEHVHRAFFKHYAEGKLDRYFFGRWELNVFERFSINCFAWLGEEFATFNGEVGVDEEWWLSQIHPTEVGKMSCICGDSLVCHYAFYPQRQYVSGTNVLAIYDQICAYETKTMQDQDKLAYGINLFLSAPQEKLGDVEFVENVVRKAGLYPDSRHLYGQGEEAFYNDVQGSWQVPRQLAELMVYLGQFRINSYIDIGTFTGWTCSLITAYLLRFNPGLRVTAVDPQSWFSNYPMVAELLPISYVHKTSADFAGQRFDLAFIDGNHEFSNVMADYGNVGRSAGIVAFHDCNDDYIRHCPYQAGGVPKLWAILKGEHRNVREFFYHPDGKPVMGIGVVNNMLDERPVEVPRAAPRPAPAPITPQAFPFSQPQAEVLPEAPKWGAVEECYPNLTPSPSIVGGHTPGGFSWTSG